MYDMYQQHWILSLILQIQPLSKQMVEGLKPWVLIQLDHNTNGSYLYNAGRVSLSTAQVTHIHSHKHTDVWRAVRGSLGFGVLLKDTSTCSLVEAGIEPPTFWLVDDRLYFLSHNRPFFLC